MKQTIKPDELTKIKHAETASGYPVKYVRYNKMSSLHEVYINGELYRYTHSVFNELIFFVEK